jgi:hypothetical protein
MSFLKDQLQKCNIKWITDYEQIFLFYFCAYTVFSCFELKMCVAIKMGLHMPFGQNTVIRRQIVPKFCIKLWQKISPL